MRLSSPHCLRKYSAVVLTDLMPTEINGNYVESWQPHTMQPAGLERSHQIAKTVTDNLGVGLDGRPSGLGLFGVELFIKGDQVWFSEVSPRPHDTGLVTLATQVQSELELHAHALDRGRHNRVFLVKIGRASCRERVYVLV